jgi:DNA-binding transcriptional LysR family regulator
MSLLEPLEPLLMPPILNQIAERAPGVSIEGTSPRAEFAQDILNGTLDLLCYAYPVSSPDIAVVPLASVDLVVITRRNHPRIGTTRGVEALSDLGFVGLAVDHDRSRSADAWHQAPFCLWRAAGLVDPSARRRQRPDLLHGQRHDRS